MHLFLTKQKQNELEFVELIYEFAIESQSYQEPIAFQLDPETLQLDFHSQPVEAIPPVLHKTLNDQKLSDFLTILSNS